MTKRFAVVLVALLAAPMILTACGTESRDNAEKYIKAVMKGEAAKAQELACEANQDTQALIEWYAGRGINSDGIDLKLDIGKGNNQKEIIITGAVKYGGEDAKEFELAQSVRAVDVQKFTGGPAPSDPNAKVDTRLVLTMKEEGGDWCVEAVDTGGVVIIGGETGEATPETTEETAPDAEATEEATPEATPSGS